MRWRRLYFKDMREVKRLEKEVIQSARMAAMGQAMAGVAHGVKNILHGMKLGAFMVEKGLEQDKRELLYKGWNLVGRNINRISRLTLDMLSYARSGSPTRQSCFVNQIVEEVCELMEGKARERRVRLVRDLDPSIPPMTMRRLMEYEWPGNLRELENFIDLQGDEAKRSPLSASTPRRGAIP